MTPEQAERVARAYRTLERTDEFLANLNAERQQRQEEPQVWTPRHVPAPEPPRIDVRKLEQRLADRITAAGEAHNVAIGAIRAQVRDEFRETFVNIKACLEVIADETGAECGKLQKQANELQTQLNEMRGELALIRALQPKRAAARKTGAPVIEGSLVDRAVVN